MATTAPPETPGNKSSKPIYEPDDLRGAEESSLGRPARDTTPAGKPTDPRGDYDPQTTPLGDSSDPRDSLRTIESGSSQASTSHPNQVGRGWRPGNSQSSWLANHKRGLMIFGGGGTLLLLPIIIFLAILLPSLKIPQLAAEIESYRLARLSRTFYNNASTLTADRAALDASADVTTADLVGKTPLGKALSIYKPARVISNMKANDVLSFGYSDGKLDSLVVKFNDGTSTSVDVPDYKYSLKPSTIIDNYKARLQFASNLKAALNESLDGSNFLVRTKVANQLLSANGVNLLWWEKLGLNFSGKNQEASDVLEAQQTEQRISQIPNEDLRTATLKADADQAEQDQAACFETTACTEEALADGGIAPAVKKIVSGVNVNTNSALGIINPVYTIAFPVCIVFDGSAKLSGAVINAETTAAMRTGFAVTTGDAQIRKGDTTAEAAGALGRQAGDIGNSVPGQLARGDTDVNTSNDTSPETGRSGEFTILNAFDSLVGGSGNATVANDIANNVCPVVTSTLGGVVLTLTNLGALLIDPINSGFEEGGEAGIQSIVKAIGSNIASEIKSKVTFNAVRNTAVSAGSSDAASTGLTYLARMLVLSQSGTIINGLDSSVFADQADMGIEAYGNAMMQQQQFAIPLTPTQTAGVENQDVTYQDNQQQSQNTYQRYFALANPHSFFGSLAIQASSLKFSDVTSYFTNFPHLLASIFSPMSHLFSGKALAAAPTNADYGMVQFGYTTDEQNLINSDPSYDPLVNAQILADANQTQVANIAITYAKCFGYSADTSGNLTYDPTDQIGGLLGGNSPSIPRDDSGNVLPDGGTCSPDRLSYDSADPNNLGLDTDPLNTSPNKNDLIFRWRLNQAYLNTLGDLESVQNPTASSAATTTSAVTP